jgi:hypothetical protein
MYFAKFLIKRYSVYTAVKQINLGENFAIDLSIIFILFCPSILLKTINFVWWPYSFRTEDIYEMPNCIWAGLLSGREGERVSFRECTKRIFIFRLKSPYFSRYYIIK